MARETTSHPINDNRYHQHSMTKNWILRFFNEILEMKSARFNAKWCAIHAYDEYGAVSWSTTYIRNGKIITNRLMNILSIDESACRNESDRFESIWFQNEMTPKRFRSCWWLMRWWSMWRWWWWWCFPSDEKFVIWKYSNVLPRLWANCSTSQRAWYSQVFSLFLLLLRSFARHFGPVSMRFVRVCVLHTFNMQINLLNYMIMSTHIIIIPIKSTKFHFSEQNISRRNQVISLTSPTDIENA